jgi:hypothetical protein
MRKSVFLVCSCLILFLSLALNAQTPDTKDKISTNDVPPVVVSGLEAYRNKGPEDAVRAWIKGSAIEGSKDALSQANVLRQIQDYYGTYQAFEVVSIRELTPKTRVVCLVLDFEKGPLFAQFVVYQSGKDWILAYFNFNTKEELILSGCQGK